MNIKGEKGFSNLNKKEYPGKGTLIISTELRKEIKWLHDKIPTEWCGVLFYETIRGNLVDPTIIVLRAKALYLMDIGSHSFTQSEYNNSGLEIMDIDKFSGLSTGMLHSHHSMGVFYSGTDANEVFDNHDKYSPFYLSLVVNNKGEYFAKIGWSEKVSAGESTIKRKIIVNNQEEEITIANAQKEESIYYTLDLDIFDEYSKTILKSFNEDFLYVKSGKVIMTISENLEDKVFEERFETIKKSKIKPPTYPNYGDNNFGQRSMWEDDFSKHNDWKNKYNQAKRELGGFKNTPIRELKYNLNEQLTALSPSYEFPRKMVNKFITNLISNGKYTNENLIEFIKKDLIKLGIPEITGNMDTEDSVIKSFRAFYKESSDMNKILSELLEITHNELIEIFDDVDKSMDYKLNIIMNTILEHQEYFSETLTVH